jgi:hypothetical protein
MSKQSKNPNANEMAYPMGSEYEKHANSPAATGADPQAAAAQQPGGGGTPGTGKQPVMPSDDAKPQWAGAKGPAESGKP